ncbi:MAG: DUF5674 family protein [Candidatus Rokuibacteriota bacterium]
MTGASERGSLGGVPIRVVSEPVALDELRRLAADQFGDFVKAVVDVRQGVMAIGAELHADEEALLLERGARQPDLWGINLYPDREAGDLVEFDSMINVRPAQGNRSRSVEDPGLQQRIRDLVAQLIRP